MCSRDVPQSGSTKLRSVSDSGIHTLNLFGLQHPYGYIATSLSLGLFIHKMGMIVPTLQVAHVRVGLGPL